MGSLEFIFGTLFREFFYLKNGKKITPSYFGVNILSIEDTLSFMKEPGHSIVRFGDGEFLMINGKVVSPYQDYNEELARRLKEIFDSGREDLLVCLPEPICGIDAYRHKSQAYWTYHLLTDEPVYRAILQKGKTYGNSFVSRPYMIYRDKSPCKRWFDEIKNLFEGKDIVIIEGQYSRTGVGNDLFEKAGRIERILCPSKNAYSKYDEILNESCKIPKNVLVIVAIGPAGKVLTDDLVKRGYWVFDLGHIDSEYEWFLRNAKKKDKLVNKHTAERSDVAIGECMDETYVNSIIARIGE